ncbi:MULTISPECIES: PEP-CTERM sorting domain-containing protein [unclassified Colwellia]|uniref:PEP-CTERM sorting domain-containing protein n=1 Tax=unclassified Colwellia TaxID=196834 RepID=UPI0015F743A9|nr:MULTISPECIES: PEP-CTERM sorting domain-containing protein [unclassified Colwellia]MBA6232125.1 PEP-CTERM sorting domain-containing protein [Colwellia sp. MB02u-7]MBA6237177.1 PEP-CTERM sorting domain-containing protein [Colwellia sp. MB02u-11]MBA6257391.1 PEP-CTERM sorting domain-containing protein [Colwellia sp. MB3u-28]MBA6260463.1 PEP-CTERM sorting domain-containing protein [Colwellia sp. MB3u-41]MBA6301559.1 PEP-CTERM sorting domain-containing protein [Colwellia sp. MB3u-22]
MKCLKWIAIAALSVSSINAFATTLTADEIMKEYTDNGYSDIQDNYIGKGNRNDINGESYLFDVDQMFVSRVGTILSVDIFTAFYNDINTDGIKLGDLFMAADNSFDSTGESPWDPKRNNSRDRYTSTADKSNTGTNWNYVYDLSGARKFTSGTGELKSGFGSNQVVSSSDLHGTSSRDNQAVMLADRNSDIVHDSSSWYVDTNYSYAKTVGETWNGYGKVSFSFDVSGTALATANQIAFRWAMTCANDIIEGVASFSGGSTPVSEPRTIVLMLLAMAGFTYRRKVKN